MSQLTGKCSKNEDTDVKFDVKIYLRNMDGEVRSQDLCPLPEAV